MAVRNKKRLTGTSGGSGLMKLIAKYEAQYEEHDLDSDCGSKGFCPVR